MPALLQPVEGDPFLQPVEGDPFSEAGIVGDVGAAQQQLLGQEAQRRATVEQFARRWTLPGRAAAGIQPATPGVLTEEDAYRLNQLEAEAHGWGPEQAAAMIGGGVPMAEKGAAGAAGGAIKAYHGSPITDLTTIKSIPPAARQFDNATSQFGAYFSPTEEGAKRYAGQTGRVYATNLDLKNPYEMPWSQFNYYQSPHKGLEGETLAGEHWANRAEELKHEATAHRDELIAAGHDGIIVRNSKGKPIEIASFKDIPLGIKAHHGGT